MISSATLGYGALAMAAGVGIPIMAAMNATLGARLESPALAALIIFLVGGLASAGVVLVSGTELKAVFSIGPSAYNFAGLFVAFYILAITWVAPRFGLGNAVFFVLLGQLIAASIIDHFGLFGMPQIGLTRLRGLGLAVMTIGVLMARKPM